MESSAGDFIDLVITLLWVLLEDEPFLYETSYFTESREGRASTQAVPQKPSPSAELARCLLRC